MCEICGVREEQLATCYESYEKVCCVLPEVADELGIPANVVVAAGAGDNAAAAVGLSLIHIYGLLESRCEKLFLQAVSGRIFQGG